MTDKTPAPEHRVKETQRETLAKEPKPGAAEKGLDYCPKCGLTGSAIGSCGNFAVGCPTPVTSKRGETITVKCGPCNKTLTLPVSNIMRKKLANVGVCTKSQCAAKIIG